MASVVGPETEDARNISVALKLDADVGNSVTAATDVLDAGIGKPNCAVVAVVAALDSRKEGNSTVLVVLKHDSEAESAAAMLLTA